MSVVSDSASSAGIKSFKDFEKTPEGWARYWTVEVDTAKKAFEKWWKSCKAIAKEFLDERSDENRDQRRLNYFWADTIKKKALLYANETPDVEVSRRYADADDDMARISGPLILQRVLQTDIEQGFDGTKVAQRHALLDFLMFGFGNAWLRYERKEEKRDEKKKDRDASQAERIPGRLISEDVVVDYIHHDDWLYSPCRTFEEMRWASKQVAMTQDEFAERFGAEVAVEVALNQKDGERKDEASDPWDRVNVREIWSKEFRKVFWFVEGFDRVIEDRDDILGLRDFWPFPRPQIANATSLAFMPRPDFALVQDIYHDIHHLMSRIHLLEKGLRLAGVYDRNVGELTRLLDGSLSNELIPVENIGNLADKGGLDAVISWLPIKEVVETISALEDKLARRQQLLYELTGDSDVTRGDSGQDPRESATMTRSRVRYSNVRMQDAQNEFARWASDLQALKAEIMVRHFAPETFLKRSNVLFTSDAPAALQAIEELKQEFPNYRVKIQSEALASQDFAAITEERGTWLKAFASILQQALPLVQTLPSALPLVLEASKWALSGLRGSASIEGAFDKFIRQQQQAAQQQAMSPQQQPPDPEMMKIQAKQQAEMESIKAKTQADLMRTQADIQADKEKTQLEISSEQQRQTMQTQANIQQTMATEKIKADARAQQERDKFAMQTAVSAMRPQLGGRQ